ncbi:hypothetical protein H2203_007808 [Taxawa tesnikishii (nom. ined.)]|nr:hypothetical protein H2203_007808 [Dothideales sp. JES 119]
MPPIPIYSDAPITPTQAKGVTPQTAFEPTSTTNPQQRPHRIALPPIQPLSQARPLFLHLRALSQPSAHRQREPSPPPDKRRMDLPSATRGRPDASDTSDVDHKHASTAGRLHALSIPPVTTTPPQITPSSTRTGPTTIPLGVVNLPPSPHVIAESPGGYVQNAYAQEMSAAQRASLEAQEAAERNVRRGSLQHIFAGARNDGDLPATAGEDGVWGL